jgi:L-fuconolactonase
VILRIDSHHHVWDLAVREQDWMAGEQFTPIHRSFDIEQWRRAARSARVDLSLLVQTVADPLETGEFLDLAQQNDDVAGVVGWVDLESSQALSDLDRHLDHPNAQGLVGIRDLAQYKPDPLWFARDDVIAAIRGIGERGLTFDLLVQPHQFMTVEATLAACPSQLFVLDHLGKPAIEAGSLFPWATALRRLAASDNLACKVSGLITEASWTDWRPADILPFLDVAAEVFGPERLMFGSDWPVCLLAGSYQQVVDLAEEWITRFSPPERDHFWSRTAQNFYPRISVAGVAGQPDG